MGINRGILEAAAYMERLVVSSEDEEAVLQHRKEEDLIP